MDGPLQRYTIAANSSVSATGTETAHTALTIASADISTARRTVRFHGRYQVTDGDGASTLEIRVRVGGVAGTQIAITPVIANPADNDFTEIDGEFQIVTTGAPGTFNSYVAMPTLNTPATNNVSAWTEAGAITTTGAVDLVVTTDWSGTGAANDIGTLEEWWAEVQSE